METRQLVLIADEPSRDWRLDDHTRQVGRAGIAAARDALRAAQARRQEPHHEPHHNVTGSPTNSPAANPDQPHAA